MLKNITNTIVCLSLGTLAQNQLYAQATTTSRDQLTQVVQTIIPNASPGSQSISYISIAQEIQYWVFALVGIIAVIYIVWVGAKLLWAPGNMEEVSTAMKSLGYILIGLALIPFAWFMISFLTSLNIS